MYVLIMAGGTGTRFWPLSRRSNPKQVLALSGGLSLIQETVARLDGLCQPEETLVVTAAVHAEAVVSHLDGIPRRNILIEPEGRNTAPCIGIGALHIHKRDPQGIMAVLPADHVIRNTEEFQRVLKAGVKLAEKYDSLITLGIAPRFPETGYGYIIQGEQVDEVDGIRLHNVEQFVEKPDWERAEELLTTNKAFWNSGMFIWKASVILEEIASQLPHLYELLMELEPFLNTEKEEGKLQEIYSRAESVSIDYGIMEKAKNVCVIPADFHWSDLGSFSALNEIFQPDADGNILVGENHLLLNSRNVTLYSMEKPLVLVGMKDVIIVETKDALLVCHKENAQDIKKVVALLEEKGQDQLL